MGQILYVGIDVSKQTIDISITVDGKKIVASRKLLNKAADYVVLEVWLRKYAEKHKCTIIHCCIEATGIYTEEISDFLQSKECFLLSLTNPYQIKSFGKSMLLRTKTDKVDAGMIAQYLAIMKPEPTPKVSKELRELKLLVRHLKYLVERRANEKNHLESVSDKIIRKSIDDIISSYDKQIEEIESLIEDHIDNHPELKSRIELLESIPGIGKTTARIILCELLNEDKNGKLSIKAQTAHAGLAPMKKESGTSVRGKETICKTGNKKLRESLFYPAMTAIRYNKVLQEFYARLLGNGKSKMVAIVAVMRKMLAISIGVLNNKTAFNPEWKSERILSKTS